MPKTYGKVYTATDMLKRRRRAFAVTTMFGAVPLTGIRRMCPGSIVIQVGTGGMEPTAYSCTERELFFADERDALISALDAGWCGKWRALGFNDRVSQPRGYRILPHPPTSPGWTVAIGAWIYRFAVC